MSRQRTNLVYQLSTGKKAFECGKNRNTIDPSHTGTNAEMLRSIEQLLIKNLHNAELM